MPTDPSDPLSKQNMKDRYYGTNDPVADKMLKQVRQCLITPTPFFLRILRVDTCTSIGGFCL